MGRGSVEVSRGSKRGAMAGGREDEGEKDAAVGQEGVLSTAEGGQWGCELETPTIHAKRTERESRAGWRRDVSNHSSD